MVVVVLQNISRGRNFPNYYKKNIFKLINKNCKPHLPNHHKSNTKVHVKAKQKWLWHGYDKYSITTTTISCLPSLPSRLPLTSFISPLPPCWARKAYLAWLAGSPGSGAEALLL